MSTKSIPSATILFKGKAKDLTPEAIKQAWLEHTRQIEQLESVDFNLNLN